MSGAGEELGTIADSIGLNCITGEVSCNLEGKMEHWYPEGDFEALGQGSYVLMRFLRGEHETCEIKFEAHNRATGRCASYKCRFGSFKVANLFPAVEFFQDTLADAVVNRHSSGGLGVSGIGGNLFGAAEDVATAAVGAAKRMSGIINLSRPEVSLEGEARRKQNGEVGRNSGLGGSCTLVPIHAEVVLPFEPRLASDRESLTQMFEVIFNIVMMQYRYQHEHGILSDSALFWLTECIEEAMDCSMLDMERLMAKTHEQRRQYYEKLLTRTDVLRCGFCCRRAQTARQLTKQAMLDMANSSMFGATSSDIENLLETVGMDSALGRLYKLRGSTDARGAFDPLLVEYLCLERMVRRSSFWDSVIPHRFSWLRQLGWRVTKTKLEALWAFAEAHEKLLEDEQIFLRFPELRACLRALVDEVRGDLDVLEEVQPRRCFFAKHLLALRVLLRNRVNRINKAIVEGKLNAGDSEGLIASLLDRLRQGELSSPKLRTTLDESSNASDPDKSASMATNKKNVWDSADLNFLPQDTHTSPPTPKAAAGARSDERAATQESASGHSYRSARARRNQRKVTRTKTTMLRYGESPRSKIVASTGAADAVQPGLPPNEVHDVVEISLPPARGKMQAGHLQAPANKQDDFSAVLPQAAVGIRPPSAEAHQLSLPGMTDPTESSKAWEPEDL
jgi:hypothetical protein